MTFKSFFRTPAFLVVLATLIYVGSASSPSLQDDADAAHAEAAREIVERGDWVTLHINGVRYLEKAPLMYWAVAASYKVFGVSEFATRLPLAVSAILLVLAVYYFGCWVGGDRAGLYAGLAVCVGLGVYLFTRITSRGHAGALSDCGVLLLPAGLFRGGRFAVGLRLLRGDGAGGVHLKGLIGIVFPLGISSPSCC